MLTALRRLRAAVKSALEHTSLSPRWFAVRTVLGLLVAWALLNTAFRMQRDFEWKLLLPALDATALLAFYTIVASLRQRLPRGFHPVTAIVVIACASLRIADAIRDQYFHRPFNVSLDLPLIPGGIRLLYHSNPLPEFIAVVVGGSLAFVLMIVALQWASRHAWHTLRISAGRWAFACGLVAFVVLSNGPPWWPKRSLTWAQLWEPFGKSIAVRISEEVDFALHAAGYKDDKLKDMKLVAERYKQMPTNLAKLEGDHVFLFLIESYGYTVFEHPQQFAGLQPTFRAVEERLGAAGFGIVSNFMDSPTYGSGSQFAQATLNTGIRVEDDFQYRLVMSSEAPSIVRFFNRAGYRTAFVVPGTRYEWPAGEFYGFDKIYDRWQFDYSGPIVGWGELPDQYTIDFVHRAELSPPKAPTFIEYALISAHGPWSSTAPLLEDWDRIGNGQVYGSVPIKRYPGLTWRNLRRAPEAYVYAIKYNFEVLASYLDKYIGENALVIALGDHQPVVRVSGRGHPHSVPIHVFSRKPAHLAPFKQRGYTHGLVPRQPFPHMGMKDFLPALLEDFSTAEPNSAPTTR